MESSKEDMIVIKEVKFGGSIDVKYQHFNGAIEEWENVQRGFKEMPHPDLREGFDDIAQQAMQIVGFPNTHPKWGKYVCKKVKFGSNNKVTAEIVFTHASHDMVDINLPEIIDVPRQVVDNAVKEVKSFITGYKKGQGDLFNFDVQPAEYEDAELSEGEEVKQPLLQE